MKSWQFFISTNDINILAGESGCFFCLGFLSQIFTIDRTAWERDRVIFLTCLLLMLYLKTIFEIFSGGTNVTSGRNGYNYYFD